MNGLCPSLSGGTIKPTKLHLTLFVVSLRDPDSLHHFLELFQSRFLEILSGQDPFVLELCGVGSFGKGRVIWSGLQQDNHSERLKDLTVQMCNATKELPGVLDPNFRWSPHITLYKEMRKFRRSWKNKASKCSVVTVETTPGTSIVVETKEVAQINLTEGLKEDKTEAHLMSENNVKQGEVQGEVQGKLQGKLQGELVGSAKELIVSNLFEKFKNESFGSEMVNAIEFNMMSTVNESYLCIGRLQHQDGKWIFVQTHTLQTQTVQAQTVQNQTVQTQTVQDQVVQTQTVQDQVVQNQTVQAQTVPTQTVQAQTQNILQTQTNELPTQAQSTSSEPTMEPLPEIQGELLQSNSNTLPDQSQQIHSDLATPKL
eukprot:TRINITY_DN11413_c0_g1_i2.p1 TRINITY_DN11413_c0_g1~~TRINITY_DN11413_c0_g1_i2.p1  ORF type:complete len:416 (+),score=108.69 TRINITY_DN11413_c0_g1_i2:138-1250(+)